MSSNSEPIRYKIYRRIDPLTARIVGFNDQGQETKRVLQGKQKLREARRGSNVDYDPPADMLSEFKGEHCLSLGQLVDEDTAGKIKAKYDRYIDDPDHSIVRNAYDGEVYSRKIVNAPELIPELASLITDELADLLRGYYDSNFSIRYVNCYRTGHVPMDVSRKSGDTYGDCWHQDGHDIAQTRLFVNMSDVGLENGPLHLLPRSETKRVVRKYLGEDDNYLGKNPRSVDFEPYEADFENAIRHTGKPGTAVIGNTELCLHRAGIPEPGEIRDMISIDIYPSSDPHTDEWLDTVELKGHETAWRENQENTMVSEEELAKLEPGAPVRREFDED